MQNKYSFKRGVKPKNMLNKGGGGGGGGLLISWGKDQTTNCHFFLIL